MQLSVVSTTCALRRFSADMASELSSFSGPSYAITHGADLYRIPIPPDL